VNLILHFPVEDHVAVCLEARVPVLSLFWGDPTPYVGRAHAASVKVFHQVGSVAEAERAAAAGIAMDLLAGQGVGLVREIKPAGQLVHELIEEARQIIAQRLGGLVQPA
jgi:NAD(P)H-dependent flavin oxidoreductase YrpB (nitropropane dioxygenase family)